MRLLTKIFLISSLLLPAHLLATDLGQGSGYAGMGGMGNTYLGFYGWLPMVKEYELTGTKGDDNKKMDVTKMERENGFGIRVVAGYQSSYNGVNLEVEGGFETRTDKLKSVETKNAKEADADGTPRTKDLHAGHLSKTEDTVWKALVNLKYVVALPGQDYADETVAGEMSFAPYVEGGLGFAYDTKKVKEIVKADTTHSSGYDFTQAGGDAGAALDDKDQTNLKKFDKSEFLFAYQFGGGVEMNMGDSAFSIGYRYFGTKDPKFSVKPSGADTKYELSQGDNKFHNIEAGIKFCF